jgi:hypothetical protein
MPRQGRQALDDREVSLPPEDGLEDSRGNCDQLEGRMVLGRLERIDAIKPRATGYDGPASDSDACQVVPSSRWPAILRSAEAPQCP